ncbi:MAG: hypothetical protein TREMPRED_001161 [Tremellales sp. Tagirdzhanova-0007]|nr:MAG: hypothetical protein TREMPRED_001161 [Tremellales sp. Tagirdzhanova-0007]
MDDEFEDLLGLGDLTAQDEDDEMLPSTPVPDDIPLPPTENELRLGRKVLALEKERDSLDSELQILKSRFPAYSTTIPVPSQSTSSAPLFTIPHELLPTLSILRQHISELTRDNEALRFTFMGGGSVASSSNVTLDTSSTTTGEFIPGGVQGVDLGAVLARVKELIRENEELGDMVLEAGRESKDEWQNALEESKAVITSLDSDLTHHLAVVQSLRAELVAYKTRFGPLPQSSSNHKKDADSVPSISRGKEREAARDTGRHRHEDSTGQSGGNRGHGPPGDKRSDKAVSSNGEGDRRRDGSRRDGSRRDEGHRPNGTSGGRKQEDREYKRRR